MFALVIAAIGFIYWGIRLGAEKTSVRSYDRMSRQLSETNELIAASVRATYEEEQAVKAFVVPGNRDKIIEAIKDNLIAAFGEDYRYEFGLWERSQDRRRVPNNLTSPIFWATQLLLSKQGKVGFWEYTSGFHLGGVNDIDFTIKMLQQVEYNLQQKNQDLRLVMEPGTSSNEEIKWSPYGNRVIFEHQLFWEYKGDPRTRLW